MPQDLILDDGNQIIPSLLNQLVYEENIMRRLQAMDTLCSACDEKIDMKLKVKEFKTELRKKYLSRVNFLRRLKLYSKINDNVETAIEYHGQDYITHPEYIFDDDFEVEITELNKKINSFVGELLKEFARGESIEF